MVSTPLKKPRWSRGPVNKRLSHYPHAPYMKSAWFKVAGDKRGLFPARMYSRRTNFVHFEDLPEATSQLHTHLRTSRRMTSLPSSVDLYEIFKSLASGHRTRFWHIASLNAKGKVVGYYSLHVTPRFLSRLNTKKMIELKRALHLQSRGKSPKHVDGRPMFPSESHLLNHANQILRLNGLQFRATPMSGYRFTNGHFVSVNVKAPKKTKG